MAEQETHLDGILRKLKNCPLCSYTFVAVVALQFAFNLGQGFVWVGKFFKETGSTPLIVRYDFDTGKMGWRPQAESGFHAIRYVDHNSDADSANTGNHSLVANVKLIGGDANLDEGEVLVNMVQTPLEGITAPVNMENVEIHMWVLIPENVIKEDKVGGVQLFVKDVQWKSLYGNYVDLGPSAKIGFWFPLTLSPGRGTPPRGGYRDPEFNPREVMAIGLRVDSCGEEGCVLEGNIFIDSVSW